MPLTNLKQKTFLTFDMSTGRLARRTDAGAELYDCCTGRLISLRIATTQSEQYGAKEKLFIELADEDEHFIIMTGAGSALARSILLSLLSVTDYRQPVSIVGSKNKGGYIRATVGDHDGNRLEWARKMPDLHDRSGQQDEAAALDFAHALVHELSGRLRPGLDEITPDDVAF